MTEFASSAIGPLKVLEEDGVKLAVIGKRRCRRCERPVLQEKIPPGWAELFFEECYNYCCTPCCPRGGGKACNIPLEKLIAQDGVGRDKSTCSGEDVSLPHQSFPED